MPPAKSEIDLNELKQKIAMAIVRTTQCGVHNLKIDAEVNVKGTINVTLSGRTTSFFTKQRAQGAVLNDTSLPALELLNIIEVVV